MKRTFGVHLSSYQSISLQIGESHIRIQIRPDGFNDMDMIDYDNDMDMFSFFKYIVPLEYLWSIAWFL